MSNFATLNPLESMSGTQTYSEGNLYVATDNASRSAGNSTLEVSSGKWYAEFTATSPSGESSVGVSKDKQETTNQGDSYCAGQSSGRGGIGYKQDGNKFVSGSSSSYGATYTTGDVIGVALNVDDDEVTFYKNGASQGAISISSGNTWHFNVGDQSNGTAGTWRCNFGQFPWRYDLPSGFLALSTDNLSEPTISNGAAEKPSDHFGVIVYEGQGGSRNVTDTDAVNFTPDLVWIKHRQDASSHSLFDSVRGVGKYITSDGNGAEATEAQSLTAFVNGGFSVGTEPNSPRTDESGGTPNHVAWCWKAGGAAVSNTDGSITSQVSANTDSGFSIVSYTGNGTAGSTVGHGLDAAPKIIFIKNRTVGENWAVSTANITGTTNGSLWLNLTNAETANSGWWDGGAPGISTFEVGFNQETNFDTHQYIAYCWHSVEGFSSIGSYTGNGLADGTFVHTGFKPKFILFKKSSSTDRWFMADTARSPFNVILNDADGGIKLVDASASDVEFANSPAEDFDIVSNGFKFRINDGGSNGSGATYIYMAFADSPYKYSAAR